MSASGNNTNTAQSAAGQPGNSTPPSTPVTNPTPTTPAVPAKSSMEALNEEVNKHKEIASSNGLRNYRPVVTYENAASPFQKLKAAIKEKVLEEIKSLDTVTPLPGGAAQPSPLQNAVNQFFDKNKQVDNILQEIHKKSLSGEVVDLKSSEWVQKFDNLKAEFNTFIVSKVNLTDSASKALSSQESLLQVLAQTRAAFPEVEAAATLAKLNASYQALDNQKTAATTAKNKIPEAQARFETESELKEMSLLFRKLALEERGDPATRDDATKNKIIALQAEVDEFKQGFGQRQLPVSGPVQENEAPLAAIQIPQKFSPVFQDVVADIEELNAATRDARAAKGTNVPPALVDAQIETVERILTQELSKPDVTTPLPANPGLNDLVATAQSELAKQLEQHFPDLKTQLDAIQTTPADKHLDALVNLAKDQVGPKAESVQQLAELAQLGQNIGKYQADLQAFSYVGDYFIGNWEKLQQHALRQFDGQIEQQLENLQQEVNKQGNAFTSAQEGQINGQQLFQAELKAQAESDRQILQAKLDGIIPPNAAPPVLSPQQDTEVKDLQTKIKAIDTALGAASMDQDTLTKDNQKKQDLNKLLDNEFIVALQTKVANEQFKANLEALQKEKEALYGMSVREMYARKSGWVQDDNPYYPLGAKENPNLANLNRGELSVAGMGKAMGVNNPGMTYQRDGSPYQVSYQEDEQGNFEIDVLGNDGDSAAMAAEAINFALENGKDELELTNRAMFDGREFEGLPKAHNPIVQEIVFDALFAKMQAVLNTQYNFYKLDDISKLTAKDKEQYANSYIITESKSGPQLHYVTKDGKIETLKKSPEELKEAFKIMGLKLDAANLDAVSKMKLESGEVPKRVKSFTPEQIKGLEELVIKKNSGISYKDKDDQGNDITPRLHAQPVLKVGIAKLVGDIQHFAQRGYLSSSKSIGTKGATGFLKRDSQVNVLLKYANALDHKTTVAPKNQLDADKNKQPLPNQPANTGTLVAQPQQPSLTVSLSAAGVAAQQALTNNDGGVNLGAPRVLTNDSSSNADPLVQTLSSGVGGQANNPGLSNNAQGGPDAADADILVSLARKADLDSKDNSQKKDNEGEDPRLVAISGRLDAINNEDDLKEVSVDDIKFLVEKLLDIIKTADNDVVNDKILPVALQALALSHKKFDDLESAKSADPGAGDKQVALLETAGKLVEESVEKIDKKNDKNEPYVAFQKEAKAFSEEVSKVNDLPATEKAKFIQQSDKAPAPAPALTM